MGWYSHLFQNLPQFIVIHTVKGFGNKAEIDVFLELSCFLHDPADVGNLISGSSAFSKTSLNIKEYYSAIKKNNIMPFAGTWMDLVIIILSEVRQTEISYCITYMQSLIKNDTNELTYKTETDSDFKTNL